MAKRFADPLVSLFGKRFFTIRILLCILAMGTLSACGPNPSSFRSGLRPERSKDRQILVTFEDRTLGRPPWASPVDPDRAPFFSAGQGWRTRRAEALAVRHRLQLVTLWPLDALGVTCGVFGVRPERPLPEVLDALRHDPGVDQVQPLQRFWPLQGLLPRG